MQAQSPIPSPVYRKALELCKMSQEIAAYISYNKDAASLNRSQSLRDIIAHALLQDSRLISRQIARAERSTSHSARLKSLHFISIMLRNLSSYCNGLEQDGVREKEYLALLRRELRSFRKTFKKWRKSFGYPGPGTTWSFNDYNE